MLARGRAGWGGAICQSDFREGGIAVPQGKKPMEDGSARLAGQLGSCRLPSTRTRKHARGHRSLSVQLLPGSTPGTTRLSLFRFPLCLCASPSLPANGADAPFRSDIKFLPVLPKQPTSYRFVQFVPVLFRTDGLPIILK